MTKMLKEILEQPDVLKNIAEKNEAVLNELVKELKERNVTHAVFAARGTSDHASIYGQYVLSIYAGIVCAMATPSAITIYNSDLKTGNDLVVGVSQSGKAADALAVLKQANSAGAVTLAITNDESSPMAKEAKYHLYCNAGLEESVAATKTFTSEMYLLALLAAKWSENKELEKALSEVPSYASKAIAAIQKDVDKIVDTFSDIIEGFVLSRGLLYPVALESALKIQETCYVKMKGAAISDFYHGPIAQVDENTPVIILAGDGKIFSDVVKMIEKISGITKRLLIVTDSEELSGKYENVLLLPKTGCEATSVYLFAIFVQYFAQCLSLKKGLNPDSPRMLKKITITK